MDIDNNSNKDNLINPTNNDSNQQYFQEEDQKEIDNNNIYEEEENNMDEIEEQNISNNEENEEYEEMIENNDINNIENEEEQIIIENENENENENDDLQENNMEEMINEENEENENISNNVEHEENMREEVLNEQNKEEIEEDEKYDLPLSINNQNKNIKIEEYESEINENKNEYEEKNEEYILKALARIKKNNKIKIKNKSNLYGNSNQSNNTEDKIVQTEFENVEPMNAKNKKVIFLSPTINSCKIEKKDNIHLDSLKHINIHNNYKYGINEEGNPVIINKSNKNKIIAYIVLKNNENEKNYLIDTKGNIIPKTEEGNYIYILKNEKGNSIKSILIKDFDVQNPELRTNSQNINDSVNTEENISIKNKDMSHLRKNIYNKSNDDIKRILNIDNNKYSPDNFINYNNLMDVWRQRYGKRSQLYQKINTEFDSNRKRENDKMVKRTNSILQIANNNYISSFTDSNTDLNNNYSNVEKYKIPKYYNGIINRKYINPLLKKYNMTTNTNRYNPLIKVRTNKNLLFNKKNNFTDFLRTRLNNSDDFNMIHSNDKNFSFEKLNFNRKNNGSKFLYINNRYNYKNNNILNHNLYRNILEKNKEKEKSKKNIINNDRKKRYSIINNNIYNIIRDTNHKNKQFKYSVLSLKANQLIKNFNRGIKENNLSNNNCLK